MRKIPGFLVFFVLAALCPSSAETIYCKDGRVARGKIQYHSRRSVWFDYNSDTTGVSFDEIDRIENDDGSISKYDFRTLYKQSQQYIVEGQYAKALDLYDILLETFPDSRLIHYLRGVLRHKLGKLPEAESDYVYLYERDAADAGVLNNLGALHAERQEYKEAKKWFGRALKKNSRSVQVHNNLADVLLKNKEYKLALVEYRRVLKLNPDNAQALYNIGYIYKEKEKYSLAGQYWERVLRVQPDNLEAKNGLVYIRTKNKKPKQKENGTVHEKEVIRQTS
ncbi:MAG: tetratricopeptide repeat protein [Candidatus Omnitrophota bacterium]|jgi:tetratricopeptide (TPR) repeat protein